MRPRLTFFAIAARTLLLPYLIGVAMLVWLPASAASKVTGIVAIIASKLGDYGLSASTSYTVLEFVANIAMFVPLGILLATGWPQLRGWVIVLMGYAATVTIELVQMSMPSRFATLSDVVANTSGAAIGVAVVWMLRGPTRSRPVPAQRPAPTQRPAQFAGADRLPAHTR